MNEDWGLGDENDIQRMENEELSRRTFLEAEYGLQGWKTGETDHYKDLV